MISNPRLRSTFAVLLGLFAILVIAASDFLAAGVGLALFYLVPVLFVAWFVDRRTGFIVSLVAVIAEVATDVLSGYAAPGMPAPYVHAVLRFALFLFVTWVVTGIKEALDREKALARTDALTGVMNARMFTELGSFEIHKAHRYERSLSVAFIDIDDFKSVNDQFGHDAGDALLQTVARTLKGQIRATDIVARLGGDEFAIILPETGAAVAPFVLNKLLNELMAALKRTAWPVTFSIGLMTFDEPPPSVQEMLRLTDLVMYEVKHSGKDKIKHVLWTGESAVPALVDEAIISASPVHTPPPVVESPSRRRPRRAVAVSDIAEAPRSSYRAWLPTFVVLALALILTTAALDALVESLPGSSLYPLKRQTENFQLFFANELQTVARVHIVLADRRLGETEALLNAARYELAERTALDYDNEVEATLSAIDSQPMLVSLDLLQVVVERLASQQDRLARLDAEGKPQARVIVEHSLVKSRDISSRLALIAGRAVDARLNLMTATTTTGRAGLKPATADSTARTRPATISPDVARAMPTSTPTPTSGATATLVAAPDSSPAQPSPAPTGTPQPLPTLTGTPGADQPPAPIQSTPLPDGRAATNQPTDTLLDLESPTLTPTPSATKTQVPTLTSTAMITPTATRTVAPSRTLTPTRQPPPTATPKPTPEKHPTDGSCAEQLVVPRLIGLSQSKALRTWREANFSGDFESWSGQAREIVATQSLAPGSIHSRCAKISVDA